MMKLTPFWTDQFPRPVDLPTHPLPQKADVAVIGSGYTGLNAALALAKAGTDVAVLEQETIGWGASSRNGSMATPGLKPPTVQLVKRYGLETGRNLWQWSLDAIDHVERVIAEEGIDCDFSRPGHVYLASKPKHYDKIKAHGEYMASVIEYDQLAYVEPKDLHNEIGSSAFHGALVDKKTGVLHPSKYVMGLARSAGNHGIKLVEKARVTKVRRQNGYFKLETAKGVLQASEVLVATGGYTTNLVPRIRMGVFPIGSYIIVTEPLSPALQAELSPKNRMFFNSRRLLNYFCLTPDGRLLFGGRSNIATGLNEIRSAKILQERMLQVFPQLKGVPITHSWTGKLGVSYDQMPHIGRIDGIHYALGFSGHGVSVASYLGHEVGKLMSGEISESLFAQIKHPRFLFASLEKFYLPFVSAYFRLEDRFA